MICSYSCEYSLMDQSRAHHAISLAFKLTPYIMRLQTLLSGKSTRSLYVSYRLSTANGPYRRNIMLIETSNVTTRSCLLSAVFLSQCQGLARCHWTHPVETFQDSPPRVKFVFSATRDCSRLPKLKICQDLWRVLGGWAELRFLLSLPHA